MLRVLPAEGGADGYRRRRGASAGEIPMSDRNGDGGWRHERDGHELSSPIDGIGHSRGWQPGAKVSMIIMRPPQQGQASTLRVWDHLRRHRLPRLTALDRVRRGADGPMRYCRLGWRWQTTRSAGCDGIRRAGHGSGSGG